MLDSKALSQFGRTGSVLLAIAISILIFGLQSNNKPTILLAVGIVASVFATSHLSDCHTSFSVTYYNDSTGSLSLPDLFSGLMWSCLALGAFGLAYWLPHS